MRCTVWIALIVAWTIGAERVYGCECAPPYPKLAFKGSIAVFYGEVVDASHAEVVYRVIEHFKDSNTQLIRVNGERGMCSYLGAVLGSRHLIWAYGEPNHLQTGLCTRSRAERYAESDLKLLRHRAWWWRSPLSSVTPLRWWKQWRYHTRM